MRVAAGVLLLLISLLNSCGGMGLTMTAGFAKFAPEKLDEEMERQYEQLREQGADEEEIAEQQEGVHYLKEHASSLLTFGVFLLVLFVLQLAAAICLFRERAPKFIIFGSALGVLAPIIMVATAQAPLLFVLISLAVYGVATWAGWGLLKEQGPTASAPPPPGSPLQGL